MTAITFTQNGANRIVIVLYCFNILVHKKHPNCVDKPMCLYFVYSTIIILGVHSVKKFYMTLSMN